MLEPKYDEDTVNLGYLKKIISDTEENIDDTYKNVSRHYASRPQPPYYKGDTWIDGDIVYTCINTRTIGLYQDTDWVTESGAKTEAERKNKTYLTQPSDYSAGDMWILQSDNDHRAGKKGEILISTAGRKIYDADDWVNMLGYGTISSINEVAGNLNNAINRISNVEEAIEDGIIITFYQETVPEGVHIGDLWYVTGELEGYTKGKIYRYDGTNWIKLDDPAIQEAFDEANEARLVADGKIQSFYSETKPTKDMGVGDLWIDIAHNNELYRYNGTNWVAVYDTRINDLVVDVETVTERVATIETDLGEIDLKVQENTTTITTIGSNIDNVEKEITNIVKTQGTATGKNIHLEDSSDEPLVSIKVKGETNQATRSGKNFLKLNDTQTVNGVTATNNDDGTITLNGTSTRDFFLYVANGTRYNTTIKNFDAGQILTQSVNVISGTSSPIPSLNTIALEGTNTKFNFFANNVTKTLQNDIGLNPTYLDVKIGTTFNNWTIFPQLEIGESVTTPEQYGASPSSDYRSPIENVEGRNKFNINGEFTDLSGGNFLTKIEGNKIIIPNIESNGSSALFDYIEVKENTDINISFNLLQGTARIGLRLYDKNKNIINNSTISLPKFTYNQYYQGYWHNGSNVSTTIPEGVKYIRYLTIGVQGTKKNIYENLQIEKGNSKKPYVPHNSLEIKSVGENFLNVTAKTTTVQGLTFTVNEDKSITINGINTGNTGTGTAFFRLADNFVLPAGDYTLSNKNANASGNSFLFYDDSYNFVTKNISNATFTKDTTIKPYIRVKAGATVNNQTIYPMILKGTYTEETMPAYKPYQEQKVTFPLGNQKLMKDSYLASGGIHHSRKQVVFDGSDDENWVAEIENDDYVEFYIKINSMKKYGISVCDKFIPITEQQAYGCQLEGMNTVNQYQVFRITVAKSRGVTKGAASIKTWLQSNPITVEYELAEPETVPYTEEQQEAWDKIEQLHTYKNVTNIFSDAELDIVYARDNGLSSMYETKQNAERNYTKTTEKLADQKMTVDGVITQVSDITSKTDELTGEVKTINSEISTVKQTIEGWSSDLKNTGGNNIFYYSLDFWDNSNGLEEYSDTEIIQNSLSQTGYALNNGSAKQTQSVKNGFYTCSFNYKKLLELAVCQVKINDITYDLTETDWAEFEQAFEVKTNVIEIEFISDTDSSLYISDLMINVGKTKLSWSQNANETRTDTVTIGKGIQVNSSAKNTYHRIDADGNRTFNKTTGKVVNEATDKGTETEELVVRGQAKVSGLLIQKVSDQVWINSLL